MRQVPSCAIIAITSSATEKRSFIQQRRNTFTKNHDCNRLHIFFGGGNIGPEPYASPAADAARWTNSDGGMTYEIALYPRHDQVRQAIDFGIGELPALGKMVPFGDAPAAARGGGMTPDARATASGARRCADSPPRCGRAAARGHGDRSRPCPSPAHTRGPSPTTRISHGMMSAKAGSACHRSTGVRHHRPHHPARPAPFHHPYRTPPHNPRPLTSRP